MVMANKGSTANWKVGGVQIFCSEAGRKIYCTFISPNSHLSPKDFGSLQIA